MRTEKAPQGPIIYYLFVFYLPRARTAQLNYFIIQTFPLSIHSSAVIVATISIYFSSFAIATGRNRREEKKNEDIYLNRVSRKFPTYRCR